SIGNKADVSSNDLLEWWEEDEQTDAILLYLESFGNPRKFGRVAARVARRKPVLALKAGTTRAGARAASSHTAALAGAEVAVAAMTRVADAELPEKPLLAVVVSADGTPAARRSASRVTPFQYPESAAGALALAADRADWLRRPLGTEPELEGVEAAAARSVVD